MNIMERKVVGDKPVDWNADGRCDDHPLEQSMINRERPG
jgi:hypothetical protein